MKYLVVYFSRTGTSRRVAEKISKKLACGMVQITDNQNWKGFIGFIKAGYYSSLNKPVEIKLSENLDSADAFIVVAPLWAGGLAPAARVFLKTTPPEKVHLVVTSDGSLLKNRSGFKSVNDIIKTHNNDEDMVIGQLVDRLEIAKSE